MAEAAFHAKALSPEPESGSLADRLIEAATAEFTAQGFQGASIAKIVARAECNVRMIYHYFGNKEGLYRACLSRSYQSLRNAETEADFWGDPPRLALARLITFTWDYMAAHPEFQGMMRIENMSGGQHIAQLVAVNSGGSRLLSRIDALLQRGRQAGVFRRLADPDEVYLSVLGLCTIHLLNRYTMGVVLGRDLADPAWMAARRDMVVEIMQAWLATAPGEDNAES